MAKEHPRYAASEWPDYEFQEWPMAIYPGSKDGGKTPDPHPTKPGVFLQECVIVQNEDERRLVLELDPQEPEAPRAPRKPTLVEDNSVKRLQTDEDERKALLEEAEVLGVQVDKRWGIARIQDAIDEFKNAEV